MQPSRLSVFAWLALIGAINIVWELSAQPPAQTSIMYTLSRQRDDFTAVDGQTGFQTQVPARSNFVEVYRNGLLQRAGATADYIGIAVTGAYKITFNPSPLSLSPVPAGGDYITLFYYR